MSFNYAGFSLIEVAIVLVIIALAVAASVAPLSTQIEKSKIAETRAVMQDVIEGLYGFASAQGRLPCPTIPAAVSANYGVERPAGGNCNQPSGFVPGATLGIKGAYNEDGLLLDAWGNPIRYIVAQTDNGGDAVADFTSISGTGIPEIRTVGMAALSAAQHLHICDGASGNAADCGAANPITPNAVAVVISLGKDGAQAVTGGGVVGVDQQENTDEANLGGGTTGITYRVNGNADLVFVSKAYTSAAGNEAGGEFNDMVEWISIYEYFSRMMEAQHLP